MDVQITNQIGNDAPIAIDPVNITGVHNIDPLTIETIHRVEQVAPIAVHLKELNQIDPFTIESLRVDYVGQIDPLRVDRLNVTQLPMVNLSVSQVPEVAIGVSRMPPIAVSLQQSFEMPSDYTARAQILGFEFLRIKLTGTTRIVPRDCARREQAHTQDRSFPEVAAAGNPAIPSRLEERGAVARAALNCGHPSLHLGR
jgi:hypothetical protein